MTASGWGRFTQRGSDEVEARIGALVSAVAAAVKAVVSPAVLEALVLIGGYGRGEGGVELRDGTEHPHNNLDFLLILRTGDPEAQRARAAAAVAPLAREHGVGIDFGCIRLGALRRAPCLVMWYDMRGGHKTVLGDPGLVPSMTHFSVERIVPRDVLHLLTNRGTLLLINELLLDREELGTQERKLAVKHLMKALIGYGDSLLFSVGRYHWSYAEKQRRMRELSAASDAFRSLYDEAIEFRFAPDYGPYLRDRPIPRLRELREHLEPIHLRSEARRLGRASLRWASYPGVALSALWREDPGSARGWARKARNWLRSPPAPDGLPWQARLGLRSAGIGGALPVLLPVLAYDLDDSAFRDTARRVLGAGSGENRELIRAYLERWSVLGDPNFPQVLRRMGIGGKGGGSS